MMLILPAPLAAALAAVVQGVPAPGASPPIDVSQMSIFDFMIKGGVVMIPLGVCSLVMLAIVVERGLQLRRGRLIPPAFLPGLRSALSDDSRGRGAALEYCAAHDGPIGRVFAVAIKRLGEPEEALERHIQEAGEREVPQLRRRLRVLAIIGSVATLLGLLGTILGMIRAFQTVAASAEALGKTELLARGIYEAMVTTAAGLIIAIPAVISYHWLSARVEAIVSELDRVTVEFIEEFGRVGAGSVAAAAPLARPQAPLDTETPAARNGAHSAGPVVVAAPPSV